MKTVFGSRWAQIALAITLVAILVDDASAGASVIERPGIFGPIHVLVVEGTAANDNIRITSEATTAVLVTINSRPIRFTRSSFQFIEVFGLDGHDIIDMSDSPIFVLVDGGNGSDWIFGSRFNDTLFGGSEDAFANLIAGGDGDDNIFGGLGNDSLLGESGDDLLVGLQGNDRLQGGPDNDILFGNEGTDQLWGDAGDDVLDGDDGGRGRDERDRLSGGSGRDTIRFTRSDQIIDGGSDILEPM